MSRAHLRDQASRDVIHVERAAFLGDHRVKKHLQQDVAQLFPDQGIRVESERLIQLGSFLDQVRSQGIVRLGSVPLAAGAQIAHERERIFKCSLGLHSLPGSAYTTRPRIGKSMRNDQRRAWIEVDLSALSDNAAFIKERARTPLLPMVKSDAYGLGVGPVVQALEALDPWGYGVATIEEGAELRAHGITRPVVVFTPLLPDDFNDVRYYRLTPTLGDEARIMRGTRQAVVSGTSPSTRA
jgi:hypothetical protein